MLTDIESVKLLAIFGSSRQTVRNAIHAFCARGLASLKLMSSRPKTVQPLFNEVKLELIKGLAHFW